MYLKSLNAWIRVDARGNKAGIHAEIDPEKERLAFHVRPEMGEIDYNEGIAEPLACTMKVLETNTDALYMYLRFLPDRL